AFIKKHIFEKAGMSQSCYTSDRKVIHQRADGYQKKESGYVNKTIISYSIPFSSGALMSTSGDLLKWNNALAQNVLVRAETFQKAFSQYKLNSGETFSYGYGWHIKDINGTASREHGGSIFGFKSMGVFIPSEDIYVIGLSNCDCHSPTQVTKSIAALALEHYKKK
ncbi:MAG: serine hydrolase, partial [Bacteroidia bacterium]|nr:serine hydrolase [Bacteroidia bacterium]